METPPFEITDTIVNLVAQINNKLGKFEMQLNNKKNLMLRKASKIKSVNSSCAIEANSLTEAEVTAVINGKRIIAPTNEILEVQNAYNAYMKISEFSQYDIGSFLTAHKYLTDNLVKESGKFRKGDVAVYNKNEVVHIGARPEFIYDLINDLFVWAKETETNVLVKSCVVHYEIETVHPFADGNGRIGRLWQSVMLYNCNNIFELLPIETLVYEHQQEYYDAIQNSREINSSTPFIEFMLSMILQTINIMKPTAIPKTLTNNEAEFFEIISSHFNAGDYFTVEKLQSITNIAPSTMRKYLNKFTQNKLLSAFGENKGRKYKLN